MGEDASTFTYFFTKRRVGFRMDSAKRRNRKRHNRPKEGGGATVSLFHSSSLSRDTSKAEGPGSSHCP